MEELKSIPLWVLMLLAVLLIAQSLFLFFHSRNNDQWKWFWGIWGCMQVPTPIIAYFLWTKWLQPKLRNWEGR